MLPFSRTVFSMFLFGVAKATLQEAQSYFPDLDDIDKEEYSFWLNKKFSSYARHAFLPSSADTSDGVAVFWNLDDDARIDFAVAVRAHGWIGFGISEAGGMFGSDVALFQVSASDSSEVAEQARSAALPNRRLVDSFIVDGAPLPDDCQDWTLKSATTEGGWIIVEMSRMLDTGDRQDRQIINDADLWNAPTHLISAWGDDDDVAYHGLNSAKLSVRLFAEGSIAESSTALSLSEQLTLNSDGFFDVREQGYIIPTNETTYHQVCKTFEELESELDLRGNETMVTMIGAKPIVTEGAAAFVHHFVVSAMSKCPESEEDFDPMQTLVYVWAPGNEGLLLPDDVGYALFEEEATQALQIQIHYNNPTGIDGVTDSSGVRFYFTHQERTHRAGVLQLGDPFVQLYGQDIKDGLTQYEFTCPETCSSAFLGDQKVTVLTETLHMHKTGVLMKNELIRDGSVVHEARVDVYDFDQQGNFQVQQAPYEVQAGDEFRTTCFYKDGSAFGLGSQEEMCIAFLFYYPKVNLEGFPWLCGYGLEDPTCTEELYSKELFVVAELGRKFGSSGSECVVEEVSTGESSTGMASTSESSTGEGIASESSTGKASTSVDSVQESGCVGLSGLVLATLLSLAHAIAMI